MAVLAVAGVGTVEVDVAADGLGGVGAATGRYAPRLARGTDEARRSGNQVSSGTDAPTPSDNTIGAVSLGLPA